MLRGNLKKDSRIGYLPHSGIRGSHRDRCSVQSFSLKVSVDLWIKDGKGETSRYRDQYRFGDCEICLNFRKRIGPVRNGREPIFVTILLPEFISDQAVRLAFSNFGEVVSGFKGRKRENISETGKDMLEC